MKDGDRVLCPCGKNIVFAAGSSNAFYSESKGDSTVTPTPQALIYDQQYTLRDSDGAPLANVRYRVRAGSTLLASGVTDAQGRVSRLTTDEATRLILEVAMH